MKFRKSLFILPNLFTLSSVFCGFYSIVVSAQAEEPRHFFPAAMAILLAMLFDGSDGRVARLTRTQSDFGMELDSLADVISFGLAPAFLLYKVSLENLGLWGLFICFVYVAAGMCRLARFNVLAWRSRGAGPSDFVGLPIPLAAGVIATLVLAGIESAFFATEGSGWLIVVSLSLSLLMVSNVPYRSFKKIRPSLWGVMAIGGLTALMIGLGMIFSLSAALFLILIGYVTLGVVEGLINLVRPGRARVTKGTKTGLPVMTLNGSDSTCATVEMDRVVVGDDGEMDDIDDHDDHDDADDHHTDVVDGDFHLSGGHLDED